MRAAMKLATGVVPVALGVAMALMSGAAKAEEKATQPLTGAVSAQTTLPSVGHRPTPPYSANYARLSGPEVSNSSTYYSVLVKSGEIRAREGLLMPGQSIENVATLGGEYDSDDVDNKQFGGMDGIRVTCKAYSVDDKGNEKPLPESRKCPVSSKPGFTSPVFTITEEDTGKRIKFVYYTESNPPSYAKYQPIPDKSLPGFSFITSRIVPKYKLSDWPVTISGRTLKPSTSIIYDVHAIDINGRPMLGYGSSIAVGGSMTSHGIRYELNIKYIGELTPGVYSYEIRGGSHLASGTYEISHGSFGARSLKTDISFELF